MNSTNAISHSSDSRRTRRRERNTVWLLIFVFGDNRLSTRKKKTHPRLLLMRRRGDNPTPDSAYCDRRYIFHPDDFAGLLVVYTLSRPIRRPTQDLFFSGEYSPTPLTQTPVLHNSFPTFVAHHHRIVLMSTPTFCREITTSITEFN